MTPNAMEDAGWLSVPDSNGNAYRKGGLIIARYLISGVRYYVLWRAAGGRLGQFDTAKAAVKFAETVP